jgi:hypothetical protein
MLQGNTEQVVILVKKPEPGSLIFLDSRLRGNDQS